MATLTIADLDNGKRDLQTVAEVATSRAATATTRFGQQTTTLYESIRRINVKGDEILSNLGFRVPVPYASGLNVTDSRFTVTGPDGKVYAPLSAPFTTGAWNPSQWYVLQNDLNDHKLLIFGTRTAAATAAATLPDTQPLYVVEENRFFTVQAGTLSGGRFGASTLNVWNFLSEQSLADVKAGVTSATLFGDLVDAFAALNENGGRLEFPPGHYKVPYLDPTNTDNWLKISTSGCQLYAVPGTVTLENVLIYAGGQYGDFVALGAQANAGSNSIQTAAPHGLEIGNYFQLLGVRNPYTSDAGEFQMGSQNPTLLTTPTCRFSEIHRVERVVSPTVVETVADLLYAGYSTSTAGLSEPIPGVTTSEIRRLYPIVGLGFQGIYFKNRDNVNFRSLLIRNAANVDFTLVDFESGENAGSFLKTSDVDGLTFSRVSSSKTLGAFSGSSWNTFVFGGGTQNIRVEQGVFAGEAQAFDVTPNTHPTDIFSQAAANRCDYLTTQLIVFDSNQFRNCSDAITTHPATYGFTATGNQAFGGSTGLRIRSRRNTVSGNNLACKVTCVSFSSFFDDTLIGANTLMSPKGVVTSGWVGLDFGGLSSETMNNNTTQGVFISGNNLLCSPGDATAAGMRWRHLGNGVPPAGFTKFTDAIKTGLSRFVVAGNNFSGCGTYVNRWFNGIHAVRNTFGGGAPTGTYTYFNADSSANSVIQNTYLDSLSAAFFTGAPTLVPPYDSKHLIYGNVTQPGQTFIFGNFKSLTLSQPGATLTTMSAVDLVDGGKFGATRSAGACTLLLNAVAADGTSAATVSIMTDSPTTGNKTISIGARLFPNVDGTLNVGTSSLRFNTFFAVNGAIATSDERLKISAPIEDREREAAREIRASIFKFRFTDSVEKKGNGARWHFGVGAQTVGEIMRKHGLNPEEYGFWCYDEWPDEPAVLDENGNLVQEAIAAGNRYGIRYDELSMFLLSSI